jgi:hypothetical protein
VRAAPVSSCKGRAARVELQGLDGYLIRQGLRVRCADRLVRPDYLYSNTIDSLPLYCLTLHRTVRAGQTNPRMLKLLAYIPVLPK